MRKHTGWGHKLGPEQVRLTHPVAVALQETRALLDKTPEPGEKQYPLNALLGDEEGNMVFVDSAFWVMCSHTKQRY